jgi:hemolysin D
LSIVPDNEPLVGEVMVKNDDIGFVYPHQKVKVKLAPYPFEEYGMIDGEVKRIEADSEAQTQSSSTKEQARDKQQADPSIYRAIIKLDTQVLSAQGKQYKLSPGMQVVAEINQGSRSVMQYLLSPVNKTLEESGHER